MNINITKRHLFYILPPFFYATVIFLLSSLPHHKEDQFFFLDFDKLLHFVEYFILGYLVMRLFATSPLTTVARYPAALTALFGILYGLSDEWHQSFVPGRCASLCDAACDSVGIVTAAWSYTFVRYKLTVVENIEKKIEQISL
jgi:VanZ family protein